MEDILETDIFDTDIFFNTDISDMDLQWLGDIPTSNEFSFQKLEDLCKQNEDELTIHTIGTVLYSANKIDLKNLDGDQIISLNIQCKRVPENGMHIHLFGVSKNYMPTDCVKHQKVTVIDLHFWNDLEIYQYAKELEQFLYQIN